MVGTGQGVNKLNITTIGIVGLPGSGKSAAARYLAQQLGATIVVMGDVIREEAKRRGIPPHPEDMRKLMVTLRQEHGTDVVAQICLQKITKFANTSTKSIIIDGLRSIAEFETFRNGVRLFHLVAIQSSPQIRYRRLQQRDRSDDPKDWTTFEARDSLESKVGVTDLLNRADYVIINEYGLKTLRAQIHELVIWLEQFDSG